MQLAKGANGRIGRQRPSQSLAARVEEPSSGGYHRNLYLSEGQIARDQAFFSEQEKRQKQLEQRRIAEAKVNQARAAHLKAKQRMPVEQFQGKKVDPLQDKLRNYFQRKGAMGQSSATANSVTSGRVPVPWQPADFSNSGANMHLVPGAKPDPVVWRSDFRSNLPKGNPLTRDGEYGPAVTDYDRFVHGRDVYDNPHAPNYPIAGNTILGRYEGQGKKTSMAGQMGFDFSWDGISDAFSNVVDQTGDNLVDSIPDAISDQILASGGSVSSVSPTGTVYVTRPGVGTTTSKTIIAGVPNWAIYTSVGLLGVGVLFAVIKAVK